MGGSLAHASGLGTALAGSHLSKPQICLTSLSLLLSQNLCSSVTKEARICVLSGLRLVLNRSGQFAVHMVLVVDTFWAWL
jgi:hypothetical protein